MSRFILGNCIDVMRGFPDRAVDLIVTDPPSRPELGPETSSEQS